MADSEHGVDRREEAAAFLATAEQDLESAGDDFAAERYHNACYMAEQASEKAVKAILILEGEFVAEHEVADVLGRVSDEEGLGLETVVDAAAFLEQYASIPRYPDPENIGAWNPLEDITREQAEEALERARQVFDAVSETLRDEYGLEGVPR